MMHDRINMISYIFAAIAGICFASGVAIITGGKD